MEYRGFTVILFGSLINPSPYFLLKSPSTVGTEDYQALRKR